MRCPQCETENPEEAWNCGSCQVNLVWAYRHFQVLRAIRTGQGLLPRAETPAFLLASHRAAMTERAGLAGELEHRVLQIARSQLSGQDLAEVARSATASTTRSEDPVPPRPLPAQ